MRRRRWMRIQYSKISIFGPAFTYAQHLPARLTHTHALHPLPYAAPATAVCRHPPKLPHTNFNSVVVAHAHHSIVAVCFGFIHRACSCYSCGCQNAGVVTASRAWSHTRICHRVTTAAEQRRRRPLEAFAGD